MQTFAAYLWFLIPYISSSLSFIENDGADRRLHCLSNPSFFTINEVAVGITTNDVLCHLSGDEVRTLPMPSTLLFALIRVYVHACVI